MPGHLTSAKALALLTAMTMAVALCLPAGIGHAKAAAVVHKPTTHNERETQSPATATRFLHLNDDAWLNALGTLLYNDNDQDGYFSGMSLSIDADTRFGSFEVYVAIDIINSSLQADTFAERLLTTRTFHVYGQSVTDEYRVDIDLVSDYSPAIYDLRVALVDAHSHQILDQVDGNDFRNLRSLSLESEDNQSVFVPVIEQPLQPENDSIRVVEYAGNTGPALFALLAFALMVKIRKILSPHRWKATGK